MNCKECDGTGVVGVVIMLSTGEKELTEVECGCVADEFLARHAVNEMWGEEE